MSPLSTPPLSYLCRHSVTYCRVIPWEYPTYSEIALTSAREVVSAGPHEREAISTKEDVVLAREAQVAETATRAAAVDDYARKLHRTCRSDKQVQKLERRIK